MWGYDSVPLAVGGDTATAKNLSLRLRLIKQHIAPGNFLFSMSVVDRADYLRMLLSNSPNIVGIETAKDKLDDCFRAHPELRNRVLHVSALNQCRFLRLISTLLL